MATRRTILVLSLLALGIAALIVVVIGSGSQESGGSAETGSALTVTVWPDGREQGGEGVSRSFSCEADSTEPACVVIAELTPAGLAPTPPDVACTEIYGGPAEAQVTGTLRGVEVDAAFSRINGCEIDRFQRLLSLLALVVPEDELLVLEGP
jgi:hypothetical protein